MKLIVGLGNPGKEYEKTRHNIGFIFLDFLVEKYNLEEFKEEKKFKGEISIGNLFGEKVILLKPLTYMNLSGESVIEIVNFYKIDKQDIIIISDDKDMEFGKTRFRSSGSAGGHNGLKSIIKHFGEDFKRVKIGVGSNTNYETSDWVLSKFTKEELENFPKIFEEAEKILVKNF